MTQVCDTFQSPQAGALPLHDPEVTSPALAIYSFQSPQAGALPLHCALQSHQCMPRPTFSPLKPGRSLYTLLPLRCSINCTFAFQSPQAGALPLHGYDESDDTGDSCAFSPLKPGRSLYTKIPRSS